ncbi:9987_t:CDS:1, partial [Ambispora leptoticha]
GGFVKGFVQASVQMKSSLTGRKRKAEEIDNERVVDKVFVIVTDAREWYCMEYILNEERKPSFKLSESVSVVYKSDNMQNMVEGVLSRIVWLLEEAQKPVDASQIDEQTR